MNKIKIFLIAGEASGDILGGRLMAALKQLNNEIVFYGIGGKNMERQGLSSIFPMHDLSIMGFVEVIPALPRIFKCISQTVQHLCEIDPDLVITIDSPDFCFRVTSRFRTFGLKAKLIHYVAPSVWAYRPERAKKIAKIYDHLLCLLPFEPQYFQETGLKASFIGHPIVDKKPVNKTVFRAQHNIDSDQQLLCVTLGSRKGEVSRLLPIFLKSIELLAAKVDNLVVVMSTVSNDLAAYIKQNILKAKVRIIVLAAENRDEIFAACDFALAKSGTNVLELASHSVPCVVAYRVNPITAFFLKRMLKIPFVTIINLICGRLVIPEFIQEHCTPKLLADALYLLHADQDIKNAQLTGVNYALEMLGLGSAELPSMKAAKIVLQLLSDSS